MPLQFYFTMTRFVRTDSVRYETCLIQLHALTSARRPTVQMVSYFNCCRSSSDERNS